MNTVMTTSRWAQGMVAVVAALAALLTAGSPLMLAEHYARTGASRDASGYYASASARRIVCSDQGESGTPAVSTRSGAKNS